MEIHDGPFGEPGGLAHACFVVKYEEGLGIHESLYRGTVETMFEVTLKTTALLRPSPALEEAFEEKVFRAAKRMTLEALPRAGDILRFGSLSPSVTGVEHILGGPEGASHYVLTLGRGVITYEPDAFQRGVESWRAHGFDVTVGKPGDKGDELTTLHKHSSRELAQSLLDEITAKGNVHGHEVLLVPEAEDALDRIEKALR